jgi:hypothetical protein
MALHWRIDASHGAIIQTSPLDQFETSLGMRMSLNGRQMHDRDFLGHVSIEALGYHECRVTSPASLVLRGRGRGRRMAAGKCGYSAVPTGTDAARLSSNPAPWPSLWTPPCPLISPTFSVRPSHWLLRASSFADLSSPRTCKVVATRAKVRQWRGRLDRRLDRRLGGACASLQKACQKRHGCICYGNVKVGNTEIRGQDHVQVTKRVFAKAGLCQYGPQSKVRCTCRPSRPNKRLLLVPKRLGFAVA